MADPKEIEERFDRFAEHFAESVALGNFGHAETVARVAMANAIIHPEAVRTPDPDEADQR